MSDDDIRNSLKALDLNSLSASPIPFSFDSSYTSATASTAAPSIFSNVTDDTHDNTDSSDISDDEQNIPPAYEVRSTKTHGIAVFATRRIPAGTLIFSEPPLISLSKDIETDHSAIEDAFNALFKPDRKSYLALYDAMKSRMSRAASIYYSNCYSTDDFSSSGGSCIGPISSRMNHSCIPNVCFSYLPPSPDFPRGRMRFHALKNIPAGKELLSCYEKNIFLTRQERVSRGIMYYGFECDCEACAPKTGFWEKSDERRSEMRKIVKRLKEFDREWDASANDANDGKDQAVKVVLCEKAVESLIKLEGLLTKEGLTHTPLANVYRSLGKWKERWAPKTLGAKEASVNKSLAEARMYKRKELEVCIRCFGEEVERTMRLRKDIELC
jgi:hypothetical protein